MGSRARLYFDAKTTAGNDEQISLEKPLPFNATLLQVSIKFDPAPGAPALFEITKISVLGNAYNILLISHDPSLKPTKDLICNPGHEFRKGDNIRCFYPNPNDVTIGLEIVFKEAE